MPVEPGRNFNPDGSITYLVDGEPVDRETYLEARVTLAMRDFDRAYDRLGEARGKLRDYLRELLAEDAV